MKGKRNVYLRAHIQTCAYVFTAAGDVYIWAPGAGHKLHAACLLLLMQW